MLGKKLNSIDHSLAEIRPELSPNIIQYFKSSVEKDLKDLKGNFQNEDGFIDYYAPKAGDMVKKQGKILRKYEMLFEILKAISLCKTAYEQQLVTGTEQDKQQALANLKELEKAQTPQELLKRKDISEMIKSIKNFSSLEKEFKKIKYEMIHPSTSESRKAELKEKGRAMIPKLKSTKELIDKSPDYKKIHHIMAKKVCLTNSLGIEARIPDGIIDVKRVFFLLEEKSKYMMGLAKKNDPVEIEREAPELCLSKTSEEETKIESLLLELKSLMKQIKIDYQKLAIGGGELNARLHECTAFYWDSIFLYKEFLTKIDQELQKAAPNLTEKGKFAARCIHESLQSTPDNSLIMAAQEKVAKVDKNLRNFDLEYSEAGDRTTTGFYRPQAIKFLKGEFKKPGKFFYLPYNGAFYTLDHPQNRDLSGALGNCLGETRMFLLKINQNKPSINNICPEPDLLNTQVNQQSRLYSNYTKHILHKVDKSDVLDPKKRKITWDDMKDAFLKPAHSKKNGDLCIVRLLGATVQNHDSAVGHAIGFIKFTDPSPYKYVVYDYSRGAMGFETDEQLQGYIEDLCSNFVSFNKVYIEKQGEVSDTCVKYVQQITPLTAPNPDPKYTRQDSFWTKERIQTLIKNGSGNSVLKALKAGKIRAESVDQILESFVAKDNALHILVKSPIWKSLNSDVKLIFCKVYLKKIESNQTLSATFAEETSQLNEVSPQLASGIKRLKSGLKELELFLPHQKKIENLKALHPKQILDEYLQLLRTQSKDAESFYLKVTTKIPSVEKPHVTPPLVVAPPVLPVEPIVSSIPIMLTPKEKLLTLDIMNNKAELAILLGMQPDNKNFLPFINLLRNKNNQALLDNYVNFLATGKKFKVDEICSQCEIWGKELNVVADALHYAADKDWESANIYLLLKEMKSEKAEKFKTRNDLNTTDLNDLVAECKNTLQEVKMGSLGESDQEVTEWCASMEQMIDAARDLDSYRKGEEPLKAGYYHLASILVKIKEASQAVNSEDMKTVRKSIDSLEQEAKNTWWWFKRDNVNAKITQLKEAIIAVPMDQRGDILNSKSSRCQKVKSLLNTQDQSFKKLKDELQAHRNKDKQQEVRNRPLS